MKISKLKNIIKEVIKEQQWDAGFAEMWAFGIPGQTGGDLCGNWAAAWLSLPNFTSTNPNQPCNMICDKIDTWNSALATAGPRQATMLKCKLAHAQQQYGIHNCASSSAPNC